MGDRDMKECTTHHYACDCREEKMLLICRQLIKEHNELKKFMAGFVKYEMCHCPACVAAMRLYGEGLLLCESQGTQFEDAK